MGCLRKKQQLAKQRSGSISWWREQAGQQRCAHVGWAGMGLGSLPRLSLVWLCSDRGDVHVAFLALSSHRVPREQLCLSPLLRQPCEQMTISGWVWLPWVGATALWWLTNVPKWVHFHARGCVTRDAWWGGGSARSAPCNGLSAQGPGASYNQNHSLVLQEVLVSAEGQKKLLKSCFFLILSSKGCKEGFCFSPTLFCTM